VLPSAAVRESSCSTPVAPLPMTSIAVVVAEQVVVVARNVDDAPAVLGLAEDRAGDVAVGLGLVRGHLHHH
jgi:hypothetical protein